MVNIDKLDFMNMSEEELKEFRATIANGDELGGNDIEGVNEDANK